MTKTDNAFIKQKSPLNKLLSGEFGLGKTFWLFSFFSDMAG